MAYTVIDVAGLKKSGKTTVVENLVKALSSKGYYVGTIKKIHMPGFTIDTEGKDTFRHKAAGADFVISYAPDEVAFIKSHHGRRGFSEIEELIPKETEFLICEELNEAHKEILYIITLKTLDQLDETLKVRTIGENIIAISGVVASNGSLNGTEHKGFRIIDSTSREGINELVDLILERMDIMFN